MPDSIKTEMQEQVDFVIALHNNDIRVVQKLMGHADVKTTEIYTHVMKKDPDAVTSPLDNNKGLSFHGYTGT